MRFVQKVLFFFSMLLLISCGAMRADSPQKEFRSDSEYYYGLKACDENKESEAIRFFLLSRKKSSDLVARRSAEALTQLGTITERHAAALYLAERWKDPDALLVACRELHKDGETAQVISLTNAIDLGTAPNELVHIRMSCLLEKKDSRFEHEYYLWTVSRALSAQHIELYPRYLSYQMMKFHAVQEEARKRQEKIREEQDDEKSSSGGSADESWSDLEMLVSMEQSVIDFRVAVYRRNYAKAFSSYESIVSQYEDAGRAIDEQILSDIGKSALYGADDCAAAARSFEQWAAALEGTRKFYAHFYAARLYDKAGRRQASAISNFRAALSCSPNDVQFDSCLWHLLNFELRTSTDDIIGTLKEYGSKISNAESFDDFFESLSVLLLSSRKWQDFYRVWEETDANFSPRTAGKYAYISGRLIEEGLAFGAEGLETRQAVDAFTRVLSGSGDFYYKVLALERLNIVEKALVESEMLSSGAESAGAKSADAGILLSGYAAFGFPQKIYSEWLLNRDALGIEDSVRAAKFLNSCARHSDGENAAYAVQSLRIASRAKNAHTGTLSRELLELCYPRFYEREIAAACDENGIPEYVMYALVRTESFFDKNISSAAGAAGLSQLMEATAADEARKLKLESYDILDAATNVRLGSHYLKSLISRADKNSLLLALFAYNGGLTNVRKWIRSSRNEWSSLKKAFHEPAGISLDLFLETLPFTETRDYGRKLVEASVLYAWLYYEKSPSDIVREIMSP